MSDIVHYTDVTDRLVPKRFLCGRKCKEHTFTRVADLVDCPQCRAKLREQGILKPADRNIHNKEKA